MGQHVARPAVAELPSRLGVETFHTPAEPQQSAEAISRTLAASAAARSSRKPVRIPPFVCSSARDALQSWLSNRGRPEGGRWAGPSIIWVTRAKRDGGRCG